MNHPSKYILHDIAEKILNQLNTLFNIHIFINYDVDPLYNHERAIIYKCIQKIVDFDINTLNPRLHNHNLEKLDLIIHKYYETYKNYDL
jgi:hypothetical protein